MHEAALALGKLTRVRNGGQPTHRKSLCLALDLMEELRVILADRLALTLVNRRQLARDDFQERPGGAIHLTEQGRKEVVVAYQKRKQDEVQHLVLDQKVPLGLVPHVQARLLARHLRGDLEHYPVFLYR